MKRYLSFLLVFWFCNLSFGFGTDSLQLQMLYKNQDSISTEKIDSKIVENPPSDSLQKQAEEIPVVFAQWWFWVGLLVILALFKFVLFKK